MSLKSRDLCDRCRNSGTPFCSGVSAWSECDRFEDREEYDRAAALAKIAPYLEFLDECIAFAPSKLGVCSLPFALVKDELEQLAVENYRLLNSPQTR